MSFSSTHVEGHCASAALTPAPLLDRGGLSTAVPGHIRTHLDVSRRLGIAPPQPTGSSWIEMCGRYNLISNLTVPGERFGFDPIQLTLESA